MKAFARVVAAALLVVPLVAGCASQRHADSTPVPPASQPVAVPCAAYHCTAQPAIALTGGYAVRLWSFPAPAVPDSATPVVELLSGGQHVSWWSGRLGFAWTATLTCLATAEPNCVVSSALGAHAGSAEILLLRSGALVSPPAASVTFDSSQPTARDLDGDGLLDVVGMENDYQPNFAQGHNYWATYRLATAALHRSGCAPVTSSVPPTTLLTGRCPVVPQD